MIMVTKATGKNLFNFRQLKPVNRIDRINLNQSIESINQSNQPVNQINQLIKSTS